MRILLALIVALGPASTLAAWGPLGHKAVARLAQARLDGRTLEGLERLRVAAADVDLRTHEQEAAFRFVDRDLARFLDPAQPLDLSRIACWADSWRRRDPSTERWHFVDLDLRDAVDAAALARACPAGDCVTGQVRAQAARLSDARRSPRERLMALAFLVHLVADLHQPLHCGGYGDHGGNAVGVLYFGRPMNLHRVWDSALLERQKQGLRALTQRLERLVSGEAAWAWQQDGPEDWALESAGLARRVAYGALPAGAPPLYLGQRYQSVALPVAQIQLAKAGVRLAWILNQCFEERKK